jgi:hypothetical protein
MDRNTIRKEITALVNSIKTQSDALANEKYPSHLELELFLHKVEKLYQKTIVLNHLSLFDGFEESEPNPSKAIAAMPSVITEPVQKNHLKESEPPIPSIAEKPKETVLVKKEESSPGQKPQKTTLSDLKSTIGINDKFQFTNELFKGNMQEFNIAIEQLNASETYESALAYITGLRRLYNWDDENETVKRLLSIIERRYN